MFNRLDESLENRVTININGQSFEVPAGETVAAAVLLSNSLDFTRTTSISKSPRAPFCLMGVCYECLMIINGQSNQRACKVQVEQGMVIQSQQGAGLIPT